VYRSTGFAPYEEKTEPVPQRLLGVLDECHALYAELAQHKIKSE
jgi:hypothetical protein